MLETELKTAINQMLDRGSKKSLVNTLLFVQARWAEEHETEDWVWYENFMRNGLRKQVPPKTKFISFTAQSPTEVTLVIHLHGCTQLCKIVVHNANVKLSMVDPT